MHPISPRFGNIYRLAFQLKDKQGPPLSSAEKAMAYMEASYAMYQNTGEPNGEYAFKTPAQPTGNAVVRWFKQKFGPKPEPAQYYLVNDKDQKDFRALLDSHISHDDAAVKAFIEERFPASGRVATVEVSRDPLQGLSIQANFDGQTTPSRRITVARY